MKKKKVLFIGLDYYEYPVEICEEMIALGIEVDYHPIFPNSNYIRLLRLYLSKQYNYVLHKYHISIIESNKNKEYDYVFFIQVHWISFELMEMYKACFNTAIFVLYNWDSIKTHDYLPYIKYFDYVYSFDHGDCIKYNGIRYLPLFYSKKWELIRGSKCENKKGKIVFVGTYNNYSRYEIIKRFDAILHDADIDFEYYLVLSVYRYLKNIIRSGVVLNPKYLTFKGLKIIQIMDLYKRSNCVIDLPNNEQNGLTMRVIEALGGHRKLITTNKEIKKMPFYNEDIICVVDKIDPYINIEFIRNEVRDSAFDGIEDYSLGNWLKTIFI